MPPSSSSSRRSLLGVFAHPDDESLIADGVLAQHAAAHARNAVVTMTWAPDSPRAPVRPRLVDTPLDEVVAALVQQIRSFRPDTLVTHDALGQLTGHPGTTAAPTRPLSSPLRTPGSASSPRGR